MALTQISTKGIKDGTITGTDLATNVDLVDNQKLRLGTGNDLQIFHSSNIDKIESNGAGFHIRQINNGDVHIHAGANSSASNNRIVGRSAGAAELYYDGSKKLETTSTGATVSGDLTIDGSTPELQMKVTSDAQSHRIRFFNTADSQVARIFGDPSTGNLSLQTGTNGAEEAVKCIGNGGVELYYDGSKKLHTVADGIYVTGNIYSNKTGTAAAISLTDNGRLAFGSGADLQIYHDGNNSKISHVGTGGLYIGADTFGLQKGDHSENYISMAANGAVELYYDNSKRIETLAEGAKVKRHDGGATTLYIEGAEGANAILDMYADDGDDLADKFRLTATTGGTFYMQNYANNGWQSNIAYTGAGNVELYYDGSKKLETTSTGVSVTGNITATGSVSVPDSQELICGDSSDLRIFHDGTNNIIRSGSTPTWIQTDDTINLTKNNASEYLAKFIGDGGVELYYDNSRKFRTYSSGVKIASDSSSGRLVFEDTDGNFCWQLTGFDAVSSGSGGRGAFQDANGAIVLDMRASGGNIFSYNTIKLNGGGSVDNLKLILGASDDLQIYHDGSHSYIDNNTGSLRVRDAGGAEKFRVSGTGTQFNDDITLSNDNDKINIGAGNDLQIYHSGTQSYVTDQGTGNLNLQGSSKVVIGNAAHDENMAQFFADGAVELYYDNSKKFETTSSGVDITGTLQTTGDTTLGRDYSTNPSNVLTGVTTIRGHCVNTGTTDNDFAQLYLRNSSSSGNSSASIRGFRDDSNYKTGLRFYTHNSNSSGGDGDERMRISSNGDVHIGKSANDFAIEGFSFRDTGSGGWVMQGCKRWFRWCCY